MRKRAILVGQRNQRDQLAGDPLGILLLNGLLNEDQVHAAWRFTILRWRLYGKPFPSAAKIYDPYRPKRGGEPTVDPVGQERYDKCCAVLRECGPLAWQEVRTTAMEQRLPAWFLRLKAGEVSRDDALRQEALRVGLDGLVETLGIATVARQQLTRTA